MQIGAHILKLLAKLGLDENSSLFYIYVHHHPDCTIADVQAQYKWSRATTYRVFDKLMSLGYIQHNSNIWRQKLRVLSLRALSQKVGHASLQLRKVQLELAKIQGLFALSNNWDSPQPVEIFDQPEEITEYCYRFLHEDWQHINCFGSGEKAYDVPGEAAMQHFVKTRAKKGKTIKAIFTEMGLRTEQLLANNQRELRDGKLYLNAAYESAMVYVYPKQVTIWQDDDQLGKRLLVIHDQYLIKQYQMQFDRLWSIS